MDTVASTSPETVEHRISRPGLIALALATLALCGIRTITHADFWIHLAAGREILRNGLPAHDPFSFATPGALAWLNSSWLYDALLAIIWNSGEAPFTTLAHVATAALAFVILLPAARRLANDTSIAVALIICAWLLAPQFEPRPFIFCLPLPAVFITSLSTRRPVRTLAMVLLPVQLLWTNLHESFFLGPAMAALFAIEAYLSEEEEQAARFRGLAVLTAGLFAVTFANPFGIRLWQHVLQSVANPTYNVLLEWISPFSSQFTFGFGKYLVTATLVIIASGFVAYRRRLPVALTSLAVLSAFALIRTSRYVDACAILAFPFLCLSLRSIGDAARAGLERIGLAHHAIRIHGSVLLAVLLAALSAGSLMSNLFYNRCGSAASFGTGIQYELFPDGAVRVLLQQAGFPERALNLAADGGFLAWTLPDRKIFTDTRDTLYGTKFYQDFGKALLGDAELWNHILKQWKPEAVIMNCCWTGAGESVRRLLASAQWRLAYFDGSTAVLLSPVSANRSLLQNPSLQAAGLEALETARRSYQDRVARERFPPNPPALIGAGGVLQALGRFKEAEAIFSLLVKGAPSMTMARASLGACQLQTGRYEEAARNLDRTVALLPKNVMAWFWLEKAYRLLGRESDAAMAHAKARALNPRLIDYLSQTGMAQGASTGSDTGAQ
ncbi:MAG: tetratricopeptide repeat protein [bacterium]